MARPEAYDGSDWGDWGSDEEPEDQPPISGKPTSAPLPPMAAQPSIPARQSSGESVSSPSELFPTTHEQPPSAQGKSTSAPQEPGQQSSQPGLDHRSGPSVLSGGASKTPRFVRPSDIYRRIEEEREKERLSVNSQQATAIHEKTHNDSNRATGSFAPA